MSSTNRATIDDITAWLEPALEKEGLEKYTINISGSSEKGDNYLGEITFVEVSGTTKTNEEKVYNFVVKSAKKSKEFRNAMPIKEAFENEIIFYDEILPAFIEFQLEKGVRDPFNNAAKCYGTTVLENMEVLILENMKKKDYFLNDRRVPMKKQFIKAVIEKYGKLHAVSFALRDQKPELFNKLAQNLNDFFKLINKVSAAPEDFNIYENVIKMAKEENENEIVEKCLLLNKKARTMHELTDPTDPYAVILHGDCWNNNFLFKDADDKNNKLPDVCFIDFQLSRLASPVYDLSYFLFTCLSENDVKDFDEINGWYYESLSNSLREMGGDPDKLFPFEELMKQWKKFATFGLIMMPSIIRLCLSDVDEVPDLVGAAESGTEFSEVWSNSVRNSKEYRARTIPIMKLAISKNLV